MDRIAVAIGGKEFGNPPGIPFWKEPESGKLGWRFDAGESLGPEGGGTTSTKAATADAAHRIAELCELASRSTSYSLANFEDSLGRIQQQIREAVEKETDPEKIRALLSASENLASLFQIQRAPAFELEKLLNSALQELQAGTHGEEPGSKSPSSSGSESDVAVSEAEPTHSHTGQLDLDALIGSSPAEQDAALDAEVILQVGGMVRSARIARGITQAELAGLAGMTQPHISEIERGLGRIGPTVVTLRRLLNALGDDLVIEHASGRDSGTGKAAEKRFSKRRSKGA